MDVLRSLISRRMGGGQDYNKREVLDVTHLVLLIEFSPVHITIPATLDVQICASWGFSNTNVNGQLRCEQSEGIVRTLQSTWVVLVLGRWR